LYGTKEGKRCKVGKVGFGRKFGGKRPNHPTRRKERSESKKGEKEKVTVARIDLMKNQQKKKT